MAVVVSLLCGAAFAVTGSRSAASPDPVVAALGGQFRPVTAARVLDTRVGVGAPAAVVAAGAGVAVTVAGVAGVPASGVAAVVVNVTVTQASRSGYVTVFGAGQPRPATSSVNFAAGQTVSNLVLAPVGAGGQVELANRSAGTIALVADVVGYVSAPDDYTGSLGAPGDTYNNSSETQLTATTSAGLAPAWTLRTTALGADEPPAIVGGIAYVPFQADSENPPALLAIDVTTGTTLWTVPMPTCTQADDGIEVSGDTAFVFCDNPGNVVAVNIVTPAVVWTTQIDDVQNIGYTVDNGRVFVDNERAVLTALDARTGKIDYALQLEPNSNNPEFAARDGVLVTSTASDPELVVRDEATGRVLWQAVGAVAYGDVTIDGGRILITTTTKISAFPEGGCTHTVCTPTWSTTLSRGNDVDDSDCYMIPGGANGVSIAVTAHCRHDPRAAVVDEATGRILNTIPLPDFVITPMVRSGDLLWAPVDDTIEAFTADCTGACAPVASVAFPGGADFPSPTISVADGTLLVQGWEPAQVAAFRLTKTPHQSNSR